jgi:hypothetical protein
MTMAPGAAMLLAFASARRAAIRSGGSPSMAISGVSGARASKGSRSLDSSSLR